MSTAVVHFALRDMAVELREVATPTIGDDDVLVRVAAVGVCGSDLHQAHNTHSWELNIPVVLGHEFAGTVAQVGRNVRGFQEGDRVTCETAAEVCGTCILCRQGRYNLCPQRKGFGYGTHGAMTSNVRVPARCLHHIPDSLAFDHAALTEPCCVAYHAVCVNSDVKPGDSVLVLGPGPIGLLCARMAVLCGAHPVIVSGLSSDTGRFKAARALGATHTVNVEEESIEEVVRSVAGGIGVDVVIDAAGASATMKTALSLARPDGQITKVGWGPQPLDASLDPLVLKNVRLQGSFSHTFAMWEKVIRLLESGQLPVDEIIGCRAPLTEWRQAFDRMHSGEVIKSVLTPG